MPKEALDAPNGDPCKGALGATTGRHGGRPDCVIASRELSCRITDPLSANAGPRRAPIATERTPSPGETMPSGRGLPKQTVPPY